MKQYLGKALKFILFFGLGLLLIWLVTHQLTPDQKDKIRDSFRNANYWILLPVLLIGIGSHLLRAVRWRLLMHPLGYRPGLFNTFAAVMIGYLANLAIPRMGEITRCAVLARNEKIPVDKLIGTMIAERAVDLLTLILLLALTLLTQMEVLGDFFYRNIITRFLDYLNSGTGYKGLLLILGIIALLVIVYFVFRRFRNTRWYGKVVAVIRGIRDGFASVGKLHHKWLFFLYSILIWVGYLLMVYVGFYCLDETVHLGWKAALAVLGLGSIGMIATQGGIGAYQLITEKTLGLYGIGSAVGYAFGWISWLAQTLLIIVVGFICMLLLPLINTRKNEQKPDNTAKNTSAR